MTNRYDEIEFVNYIGEKYKEARGEADYVVIVDVDEFLYAGIAFHEALDFFYQHEILAVQADGYQMLSDKPPPGEGQLTDIIRLGVPDKIYSKMAVFDPFLNVRWSVGRHSCRVDGYVPIQWGLKLLHYRYFGEEYMLERNSRNDGRKSERDILTNRSYHVDPEYTEGRYSIQWFKHELETNDWEVVSEIWQ